MTTATIPDDDNSGPPSGPGPNGFRPYIPDAARLPS